MIEALPERKDGMSGEVGISLEAVALILIFRNIALKVMTRRIWQNIDLDYPIFANIKLYFCAFSGTLEGILLD
jgi:hypothetical protein